MTFNRMAMKTFTKILATSVLALLSFSACEVEPIVENVETEGEYLYNFNLVSADAATKTTLDGTTLKWEGGDKLGFFAKGSVNKYGIIETLEPTVQVPVYLQSALDANDKVYAYFPYKDGAKDFTSVPFSIPSLQTGDMDANPLISIPYVVSDAMASGTTNVDDMRFCNLGSVILFKVFSSVDSYRSEIVNSITFESSSDIAGDFTIDAASVDYDNKSTLSPKAIENGSKTISLSCSPAIGATKADAGEAYMVVIPGSYTGTVTVSTNAAVYTYPIAEAKEFSRSSIKPLNIDLGKDGVRSEQKYFRKVTTDHNDFSGTYLIVSGDKAFKGSVSDGSCIDVTVANSTVVYTDDLLDDAVTIIKDNDTYYLKNKAGEYLYLNGTTSAINTSNDPQAVTITFDTKMQVSSGAGTLKCKDGDKIKFYTGNNPLVDFYVLDGTEIPNDPNIVSLAVGDVEVPSTAQNVEVEIHCNKDWTATAESDYLENDGISINGTSATTSFIVPFKEANTDVKNGKVVTVTISAGEGDYHVEKKISVTQKAPLPKLTLNSTSGEATKDEGSTVFNVTEANFEWSVLGITVDDVASVTGYTAVKTPGEGNLGSVTISYPENATNKAKKIVVTVGDSEVKTVDYTLTQAAGQTSSVGYNLVTNISELAAGDVILLGCSSKTIAAGSFGDKSYFTPVSGTFSNGTLSSEDAIEITLGKSGDYWTLTTSEGTIATTAAKSINKTGDGDSKWTISIANDGTATIKSSTTTYGWIQYNASSPRFCCYTSAQTAIQIYKKADSRTAQSISYSKSTGSIDLYSNEKDLPTLNTTGVQTSVSYESSNTDVATIDGSGIITAKAVGTTTIKATAAENETYKPAVATFVLTVTNTAPVITILKSTESISSAAGTNLTIASAYSLSNVEDSGITVSYTGNITSASILGGTVTYSISENTSTEASVNSTITLKVTSDNTISGTITITQAKKGGQTSVTYSLTSEDIASAHTTSWSYTSGTKTINAADGSAWIAYNTFGNKNQETIQMNTGKGCYVQLPKVSGMHIVSLTVVQTGTRNISVCNKEGEEIASVESTTLTSGYTLPGAYDTLRLYPLGGATYISSITVVYSE